MTRIVLVGNGAFGSIYRKRLLERLDAELVGLVDSDTDKLTPDVPVHAMTLQHLIDNLNFDAVVIATPPQNHYHIAAQALMNDKDVFCAKPCTLGLAQMMQLRALADKHKKKLFVDYTMLAAPEQNTLDQLFAALGDPRHMEAIRETSGAPRPEGIVYDLISHDVATFLYHSGAQIASVSCEDTDNGTVARLFNEEDREVCLMRASYNARPDKRVIFHTEQLPALMAGVRIGWDHLDRSISIESRIGEQCIIDFHQKPDPITLAFHHFINGYYDDSLFMRVAAICEMLNESLAKNTPRVEAP